ncbi:unnamed protein product [Caretta caretta]
MGWAPSTPIKLIVVLGMLSASQNQSLQYCHRMILTVLILSQLDYPMLEFLSDGFELELPQDLGSSATQLDSQEKGEMVELIRCMVPRVIKEHKPEQVLIAERFG